MSNNKRTSNSLIRNLIYIVLVVSLALSYKIYTQSGSPFGWIVADLQSDPIDFELAGMAVFQFVLLALLLDLIARQAIAKHNEVSANNENNTLIPSIITQMVSSVIYIVVALVAFILLYDHKLTFIITSIGAIGIGIAYVFRDIITELVNSVTIQSDRLISIDDWLEVDNGGSKDYLKVLEINHRMVMLENLRGYVVKFYNQKFLDLKFINLTKQSKGMGVRRKLDIQLSTRTTPEQVLPILESVMEYIIKSNENFLPWHNCQVATILEGVVTYEIWYECKSKILLTSDGIVNLTLIRYLKVAGISLYRLEAQNPLVDFSDVQNRLIDSSAFGILKF